MVIKYWDWENTDFRRWQFQKAVVSLHPLHTPPPNPYINPQSQHKIHNPSSQVPSSSLYNHQKSFNFGLQWQNSTLSPVLQQPFSFSSSYASHSRLDRWLSLPPETIPVIFRQPRRRKIHPRISTQVNWIQTRGLVENMDGPCFSVCFPKGRCWHRPDQARGLMACTIRSQSGQVWCFWFLDAYIYLSSIFIQVHLLIHCFFCFWFPYRLF